MKSIFVAFALVAGALSCGSTSPEDLIRLSGSVIAIFPSPTIPGEGIVEISIAGADPITFPVRERVSVVIQKPNGLSEQGSLSSFAIGDSVVAWYPRGGIIIDTSPAGYPVVRVEIVR